MGSSNDNGVLYLYGPTGLVMEFDRTGYANDSRTLLFDPQGNAVCSSNGAPVGGFLTWSGYPVFYDAYGLPVWVPPGQGVLMQNLATAQPFQYKGQYGCYTDGASSLIYCSQRYYDPLSGRWTSRDPSGLDGGVNVYAYVDGNPVTGADPSGLDGWFNFEFSGKVWLDGLATGSTNLMRGLTFGAWRHPEFEGHVGADVSGTLGAVARESIIAALSGGTSTYLEGVRSAGAAGEAAEEVGGEAIANAARAEHAARSAAGAQKGYAFERTVRNSMGLARNTYRVLGGSRRVDGYAEVTNEIFEMKSGYVSLNSVVRGQIAKDAALRAEGTVRGANWIFAKDAHVTKGVFDELARHGINILTWPH